jgi:hypothetical protein
MSTLHRFFNDDDERRREIDRLLESLDAASATQKSQMHIMRIRLLVLRIHEARSLMRAPAAVGMTLANRRA